MDSAVQKVFFDAVRRGSVEEVKEFVSTHGKQLAVQLVNLSNKTGETPLLLAVTGNHKEMVAFFIFQLIDDPISPNGKFEWRGDNYEGITPLFAALVCSNTTRQHIIKTLILLDFYMVNSLRSTMSSTNTRSQKIDVLELLSKK